MVLIIVYVCVDVCGYVCICMYVCVYTCVCVCVCVCVCACVCVHKQSYKDIHGHIWPHTQPCMAIGIIKVHEAHARSPLTPATSSRALIGNDIVRMLQPELEKGKDHKVIAPAKVIPFRVSEEEARKEMREAN